jgi:hypothetical protein
LVIAILVMLVLSTLSLSLLTRTLSLLESTRMGQDYDAALAAADAGLADAMFKIDQFGSTKPSPEGPSASGATDSGSYVYATEKIDDRTYIVRSRGSVGGAHHAISARVTRTTKFPFALFSRQNLTINGSIKWPAEEGPLPVGSNATTVCHGSANAGTLVARATNNKDCPGFEPLTKPIALATVEAPAGAQACPADGVFSGSTAGTFVCRRDVSFAGTVTPPGPLAIYILPSVDGIHHSLDLGSAIVNVTGPAANVQIYKAGNAPIIYDSGNTSDQLTFRGVIYAPDSTFVVGGGGKSLRGSFVFNEIKLNGGPNFSIAYDAALQEVLGNDWTMSRYTEISSSSPGLPSR